MPSTYAAPIKYVPTAHCNHGSAVTLPFQAILGRNWKPDWENVPTATGLRVPVVKVNACLYGRRWHPQPFADALISLFLGSDVTLYAGYIGHSYLIDWKFQGDPITSLYSGSLPPGLSFTQVSPTEWTITGTPTTIGTYTFVLKCKLPSTGGFITFHITIYDDPDEGSSYVGAI